MLDHLSQRGRRELFLNLALQAIPNVQLSMQFFEYAHVRARVFRVDDILKVVVAVDILPIQHHAAEVFGGRVRVGSVR